MKWRSLSVDVHALDRETRDVIDRDVLELWVFRPVFVEDEEQFLRSAEGEDRQEDASAALEDRSDEVCGKRGVSRDVQRRARRWLTGELGLLLQPRLVRLDTTRRQ